MHIYDFITDETQYLLKRDALNGLPVFEANLNHYQSLFLKELNIIDSTVESRYLNIELKTNPSVIEWFGDLEKLVKADAPNLIRLFEDISEVYQIFLSGNNMSAVMYLHHLLEKYDLLDESYADLLGGFVRGRFFSKGEKIIEESFFYHIPFFKRFLIANQRFSFSGHPLLYAGQSLISVFFELGAESLDDERIATCLLAFDHFADLQFGEGWEKVKPRNKIYDITNSIYEIVNDTFFRLIELGIKIPPIDAGPGFPKERILRSFRKFILSHCCTFPKRIHTGYDPIKNIEYKIDRPHFVEEYALPQLLTQAVRLHKYNGILYPSTKFIDKDITVSSNWHSNIYRTNLAMFTEYKVTGNRYPPIDKELFEVLKVDTIDFTKMKDHGYEVASVKEFDAEKGSEQFLKGIKDLNEFIHGKIPVSETSNKILTAAYHIEKKILLYQGLKVSGVQYFRTLAGKMEYIYLLQYYRFIREQFYRLYRDIIDAHEEAIEQDETKTEVSGHEES